MKLDTSNLNWFSLNPLRNVFVSILCLFLFSCTKTQALFESEAYVFPGISEIIDNEDGTFSLNWKPVPFSAESITYFIYSRLASGQYNFNTPTDKTAIAKWKTPNLRFAGDTCFVVRFLRTDLPQQDFNTNEKCTTKPAYVFKGIDSVTISSTGVPTLVWTAIPQDAVLYQVYDTETKGAYDFKKPLKVITGNTYEAASIPLSSQKCFVVRYAIVGIIDDTNTNEVCPSLPYISGFNGIDSATSTDTGMATVSWTKPTTGASDVAGYRVYSGTDFKTQVGSTTGSNTTVTVGNLTPDATVTLGVRAFDKYGREDTNTRTVSVTIVNNALPNFGGVDLLTQKSANTIEVKWVASDIKPAKYNIYKASGTRNTTFSVETSTALVSVSADTYSKDVSPLGDDQSHCFAAKAETSGGQKDTNTVVKCLTLPDNGAPVFSGVKTVVMTAGKATVTWDEAIGETTTYRVFYQVGGTLNFGTASSVDVASPLKTVEIAGLTDSTNYTFGVRAIDRFGVSDTNTATLVRNTGDVTPPVFNGIVSATVLDENNIQMVFNKSTETDVSYYSLRTRQNGASNWLENKRVYQNQISGATHTITLDGLTLGTTYDLIIKVVDTSANESTNASVTQRTTADLTPPTFAGVESATGVSGTPTSATISWNAATDNSGIKEYRVFYSTNSMSALSFTNSNFSSSTATISGVTITRSAAITSGTSLIVSGLTANTTYYFRVHAIDNQNNENANARQNSYSVPDLTAPSTPVASFSPSAPSGATSQRTFVLVGTATQGNEVRVYANGTVVGSAMLSASTSFNITSTLPNASASYVITVKQANGIGIESAAASMGTYILDVSGPTITVVATPNPTKIGDALSLAPSSTFTFSVNEGGTYVVKEGSTSLVSGTVSASTNKDVTVAASQLSSGDGTKTITLEALDAAGNVSTYTFAVVVDTTAPPAVTNFSVIRNEQTGKYQFSWTPVGLESTDIVRIRKVTGSLTPPANLSAGVQDGSDIPATTVSAWSLIGTETLSAFRAFTCDTVGNCSIAACATCSAAVDGGLTFQNLSHGEVWSFKWTDATATTTVRSAYSRSKFAVGSWDGVTGSVANGAVVTEGDAYCPSANTCSITFTGDSPWQRRYWRVSSTNTSAGGNGVLLSKVRVWAKVPSGMVFVAKEEWPENEYGQMREMAYDYAIDQYEATETTTTANPGGNAGSAAYPNSYNSVLVSNGGTPKGAIDWYRLKQGCENRTSEPEVTAYVAGTGTTVSPRRKFHLTTALESFVAAFGTPDQGGSTFCNTDNRGSGAPIDGNSSLVANCRSYFNSMNMIGNVAETVDEYYSSVTWHSGGTWNATLVFYGGTGSFSTSSVGYAPDGWNIGGFDYKTGTPNFGSGSGVSFYGNDTMSPPNQGNAMYRGGSWESGAGAGRFATSTHNTPRANQSWSTVGGRCALQAP